MTCTMEGCASPVHCKGLCNRHYKQARAIPPSNLCACGCGGLTRGRIKTGHNTKFFSPEEQARRGRMNDGSALRDRGQQSGYRKVGQRHEHRAVAEANLGRPLVRGEVVHHVNGNHRDNRPENLQVMSQAEHARLHMLGRRAVKV